MLRLRIGLLLLGAAGSGAALAQDAPQDLLRSPACRSALDALQAGETAIAVDETRPRERAPETVARRLAPLRARAAQACLGAAPPPPGEAPAPATVPPPRSAPAASAVPLPLPLPPRPVPAPAPAAAAPSRAPVVITSCDVQGCWASDGTRLQRAGSQLLGPKGFCSTAGALLNCP